MDLGEEELEKLEEDAEDGWRTWLSGQRSAEVWSMLYALRILESLSGGACLTCLRRLFRRFNSRILAATVDWRLEFSSRRTERLKGGENGPKLNQSLSKLRHGGFQLTFWWLHSALLAAFRVIFWQRCCCVFWVQYTSLPPYGELRIVCFLLILCYRSRRYYLLAPFWLIQLIGNVGAPDVVACNPCLTLPWGDQTWSAWHITLWR